MRSFARLALAVSLSLAAGCKRAPPPAPPAPSPRLVQVRVGNRATGENAALVHVDELRARAAEDLRRSHAIPVVLYGEPVAGVDYRLDLDVNLEIDEVDHKGVYHALVVARMSRVGGAPGEAPIVSQAVTEQVYERSDGKARAAGGSAHLEHALDDVMRGLADLVRVRLGPSGDLVAALDAPDTEVRAEAVRVAGARKDRAALPRLLELVKSPDPKLRDSALGALVEIGDPSAVATLTHGARFNDLDELPKLIDAVGSLGGEDAHAFLEFIAGSHDSPEMRDLAKEAIARMERRRSAASSAAMTAPREGATSPRAPTAP